MRRSATDLARLDRLFDAALTMAGDERDSFLAALAEDEPLAAAEVRALLAGAVRERITDQWGAVVDAARDELGAPAMRAGATSAGMGAASTGAAGTAPGGAGPAGTVPAGVAGAIAAGGGVLTELEAGERVGPYRLLRLIGSGGMAAVYLAERVDGGFSQRVALKLVPRDLLSAQALGRFEQERQILADLDHPNIARLLDGGVDARGRSYIAMEFVEGVPIDRYCLDRGLSIPARLDVFAQVMEAVQYAHRHLVIHRDLKPSNILVTVGEAGAGDVGAGDVGTVKLLDFGIAKLLDANTPAGEAADDSGAAERSIPSQTRTLFRVLTPAYASPEQLRGEAVTTASDVYQLGLLLYELLTGERASSVGAAAGPARAPRAASAAAGLAGAVVSRATRRNERLGGDLDNIVSKALEPDPAQRYGSPADLARDLDRYRHGLPVSARNATRRYRLAKFLRRHVVGVTVGAAMAAVLCVCLAMLVMQTIRLRIERNLVRQEAAKAGEIRDFLTGLFDVPLEESAPALSARDLVDRAAARLATVDPSQPLLRAQMLHTLGGLYIRLGSYDRARTLIEEGLALRRQHLGEASLDTAESHLFLGMALNHLEDHVKAEAEVRRAVAAGEKIVGPNYWGLAFALTELGSSLLKQRRYDEAQPIYERAAAIYRRVPSKAMGAPTNALGLIRAELGDYEGASRYYREALAINVERFGDAHPLVQTNRANLASALLRLGKPADATVLLRDVVAARRRALGADHPEVGTGLALLGRALRDGGDLTGAEPLFTEALTIYERRYPAGHSQIAAAQFLLGRARVELGRPAEAEPLLRAALASQTARLGAAHQHTQDTQHWLDVCLQKTRPR